MDRPQTDPKLGEVKAVLQRLQAFSAEPNNAPLPDEAGADDARASEPRAKRRAPAAIGLTIAGTAVVVLGLVWLTVTFGDRSYLPAAATPDATTGNRAISERDASAGQPVLRPSVPPANMGAA